MRDRQTPAAEVGDWIYDMHPGRLLAHLVKDVSYPTFSSIPHASTSCGRDYQVGDTTMSTRPVAPDHIVAKCGRCEFAEVDRETRRV